MVTFTKIISFGTKCHRPWCWLTGMKPCRKNLVADWRLPRKNDCVILMLWWTFQKHIRNNNSCICFNIGFKNTTGWSMCWRGRNGRDGPAAKLLTTSRWHGSMDAFGRCVPFLPRTADDRNCPKRATIAQVNQSFTQTSNVRVGHRRLFQESELSLSIQQKCILLGRRSVGRGPISRVVVGRSIVVRVVVRSIRVGVCTHCRHGL